MSDEKEQYMLIDKPAGWTSFDVVNVVRRQSRIESGNKKIKVGHAGTLDPFATGLLIVGVGREATKHLDDFKKLSKTYIATIHLGEVSDTDDPTGTISVSKMARGTEDKISAPTQSRSPDLTSEKTEEDIKNILNKFTGEQTQIPPMYSAKKIDGQRLYKLARAGKTVERQPQHITIHNIRLLNYDWPRLEIEVECSAGTYIRTLARDIGEALGVGGYCEILRRTRIGQYKVEDAAEITIFDKKAKI